MNIVTALDDPRTISSIIMQDAGGALYAAGPSIEIHAYGENGMYCELLWFAVIKNGEIIERLNGAAVESITYLTEEVE